MENDATLAEWQQAAGDDKCKTLICANKAEIEMMYQIKGEPGQPVRAARVCGSCFTDYRRTPVLKNVVNKLVSQAAE